MVIYAERRKVLEGADLHEQVRHFIDDVVEGTSAARPPRATPRSGTSTSSGPRSRTLYPVGVTVDDLDEAARGG